jgi:ABC-type uncharacterized transport system
MEVRRSNGALGPVVLFVAGLVLVFLGERVFSAITGARWVLTGGGFGLVVAYFALRIVGGNEGEPERRSVNRLLAVFAFVAILALGIEFLTTEAGERLIGLAQATTEKRDRFEAIAIVTWITLLMVGTLPILFAEAALFPMRHAQRIEARRVLSAEAAGLTLALAAVYGGLFTYAAGEFDIKADFSYFRTARPSESTKNIINNLSDPLKVVGFFPQLSDVGREVNGYLKDLAKGSPRVTVEMHDRLLEPKLAKDTKVTQDGVLVIMKGADQQTFTIGDDMEKVRPKLKTLDTDFQKVLLKAIRPSRVAYLTTGHGEINEEPGPDGRAASGVRKLFESQNYSVKDLGLTQGLGTEIPSDATVVVVLGPARPFLPGELATLKKYALGGGHLLLALDPDSKADLDPLAEVAGLTTNPIVLANERAHLQHRFNNSDRAILVTNKYSSHASISTLSRNAGHAPIVLPGAASLDKRHETDPSFKVDFTIKSLDGTFADANGDFIFQDGEKKSTFNLGAAVSRPVPDAKAGKDKTPPEMRLFVLGDADALTDAAFGNEPNIMLFIDAIRWLGGEESFTGAIATTEDVKIEHTRQKDLVWFYGTIFAVPAAVLMLGLAYGRRRGRRVAAEPAPKVLGSTG